MTISNGGPPLVDSDIKRMDYVLFHIKDFLQGVRGMKFADVGAYILVIMHLYDMMGDLPDDDRWMALHLCVDVRTWKTAKARLLALGKIEIRGGRIWNKRVEDEITDYVKKVREKREAADELLRKREAEKKARRDAEQAAATKSSPANSANLVEDRSRSLQTLHGISDDLSKKPNENNGRDYRLDKIRQDKKEEQQHHPAESRSERMKRIADEARVLSERLLTVSNGAMANAAGAAGLLNLSPIMSWLESGADPEGDIVPAVQRVAATCKAKGMQSIRSWEYFNTAIAEAKARREAGLPQVQAPGQKPLSLAGLTPEQRVRAEEAMAAAKARQGRSHV